MNIQEKKYELIKFNDGDFSLDVKVSPDEDTVWLNREQLALLFKRDIKTISKHINNALKEECINSTVAKFATVQNEGTRQVTREIEFFNLYVITSIGYMEVVNMRCFMTEKLQLNKVLSLIVEIQ